MKKYLLITLAILGGFVAQAQTAPAPVQVPEIGKPCPPITFDQMQFYKSKTATLKDFRGKWLILDCWAKNCSSCIARFPHVDKLQKELGDRLQFLMVTYRDKEKANLNIYNKYHKALGLTMPNALMDSVYFDRLVPAGLPYWIVIDPQGIVRVVATSIGYQQLMELMSGKQIAFDDKSFAGLAKKRSDTIGLKYNPDIPFEVNNNGAKSGDFMFRSLLSKYKPGNPGGFNSKHFLDTSSDGVRSKSYGRYDRLGHSLKDLYTTAYFGLPGVKLTDTEQDTVYWTEPILEIADKDGFQTDWISGKGYYCYSLTVPPEQATEALMMEIMQSDLKRYFGYNVRIELRDMPCLKLVASEKARKKLLSKSNGEPQIIANPGTGGWTGGTYLNYPMHDFFGMAKFYADSKLPMIDDTGITGKIDISVEWFQSDLNSVRKALQKNGLDLIEGAKKMKVLVISDPKQ